MAKHLSNHYVRLGGFRCWILPSAVAAGEGFRWANTGEQCDSCGGTEFSLSKNELVCNGCKDTYTILNADGTPATDFYHTVPTKKEATMAKSATPSTKKIAKGKPAAKKAVKIPRIGFGPFLRVELTKAPKTTISVSKLAATMVKKFASTKRDERHMRGWIYGIHRLLTKKGAAVSKLDRGDDKPRGKAKDIC